MTTIDTVLEEQVKRAAAFVYAECSQDIREGEFAVDTLIRIVREYHALQMTLAQQPNREAERLAWRTYAAAALVAGTTQSVESLTRDMMALEVSKFGAIK